MKTKLLGIHTRNHLHQAVKFCFSKTKFEWLKSNYRKNSHNIFLCLCIASHWHNMKLKCAWESLVDFFVRPHVWKFRDSFVILYKPRAANVFSHFQFNFFYLFLFFISVTAQFVRGNSLDNISHLTYFVKWAKQGEKYRKNIASVVTVVVRVVLVLILPLKPSRDWIFFYIHRQPWNSFLLLLLYNERNSLDTYYTEKDHDMTA